VHGHRLLGQVAVALRSPGRGGGRKAEGAARLVAHAIEHGGGRDRPRIIARSGRVGDSQLVGLILVVAAVLEEDEPERGLGRVAVLAEGLGEDGGEAEAKPGELLL
jgi:hypothetical protein